MSSLYMCNECDDRAYRHLHDKLNKFTKILEIEMRQEKNDIRKMAFASFLDSLENFVGKN